MANDYLHRVGPVIREHDGFIDKYIGDAIMGLFPGKADDALNAAIALQREIRVFNLHCEKDGKPTIAAGVGIHTGDLMLGTIGERGRMETTVIADAVNAASRLETATKTFACSMLLSRETKDALAEPDRFSLRRLGMLQIKGKCEKLEAFECYDGDPADVVEHKQSTAQKFAHALAALEAGGFTEAQEWFSPIAEACASDGPAAFYLQHARA
ncbi:MAG: adenylate/guanylate cyclase domain-containing protein [Candidatus Cybelea sp.]